MVVQVQSPPGHVADWELQLVPLPGIMGEDPAAYRWPGRREKIRIRNAKYDFLPNVYRFCIIVKSKNGSAKPP